MSINGPQFSQSIAKRDRFGGQMQRIWEQASSDAAMQWTAAFVNLQKVMMNTYWIEYQKLQSGLMMQFDDNEDQLNYMEDTTKMAAEVYESTIALLDRRLSDVTAPSLPSPVPPPKPSEIVLPKFDGDYTAWTAWRSQFVSRVYQTTLPVHSKLDLLFGALAGEAKLCAGMVDGRDQCDLDRVWAKLEQVYDNKYQLVRAHCDSILDLPVLSKPDPAGIRCMVDTFEKESDALKRFDFDVNAWSPLLAVIMLRKLDGQTRSDWEMIRDVTQVQSLPLVTAFLEKKIQALRNRAAGSGESKKENIGEPSGSHKRSHDGHNSHQHKGKRSRNDKEDKSKPKSDTQSDKPICLLCEDKRHFLWHCAKFRSLALAERLEQVTKWKLCPCCLIKSHASDTCKISGCSRCDGAKHNNMLCPKYTVFRANLVRSNRKQSGRGKSNNQ